MTSSYPKYISKLRDARVLVLGGTSGIGFCAAEAALEHGAHVCLSGSKQAKLDQAISRIQSAYPNAHPKVFGQVCDLSQPQHLESNVETLLKAAAGDGKIDHIVFTAGDTPTITPVADITIDLIYKAGNVRFMSAFIIAKLAPKYMTPGPKSSITLTTGIRAQKPATGWSLSAAWGSGIEGMARGLALDLAPLRINVVSPGAVDTEAFDFLSKEQRAAVLQKYKEGTLVGNVGKPEDLAEAYLHCMKDCFLTGTVLASNGGALLK